MQRIGGRWLGQGLLALAVAASGCSHARYPPHGDVRVATLGIVTLEPRDDDGDRIRAMHVRLVVDDEDDAVPWQLDTREQIGSLDDYGQSRPAFATASIGRPPIVTIAAGGSATVDLYYPLPGTMQKASKVPHFEVLWRVQTSAGAIAERTTFERLRIEPPPAPDEHASVAGWWGPGWYDPFWPDDAFWDAPVLGPVFHDRPVVVARPPAPPLAVRVR